MPNKQPKETRTALVLIDYQHDFVNPTGALAVPGAQDDVARLLTWLGAHEITTLYVSLDTHLPLHIFYPAWWQDAEGKTVAPFTAITVDDVESGRFIAQFDPDWSLYYVKQLARSAQKELMIWPHHTMLGTLGHTLPLALSEAITQHSIAHRTQPVYVMKGLSRRTECYSLFGAEVVDPEDPASRFNLPLLEAITAHDRVYIAGEAKSHCVLESLKHLLHYAPERANRLHLLHNCTSSVAHPTIDFDTLAEAELAAMQKLGLNLCPTS